MNSDLISLLVVAGGLLAAFLLGKRTSEKNNAEKKAKNYKNEAKKWANAGNESIIDRLHRISKERDNS